MSPFQFQTVPNIIAGLGSIQQLKALLTEQNNQRVLLVTDPGMVQLQLHAPVLEILEAAGCNYCIYSSVQADPPEHIVLEAAEFARQNQIDTVIGFGAAARWMWLKLLPCWPILNRNSNCMRCIASIRRKNRVCLLF